MLIEIFEPYLLFLTIFLTLILNLVLILKNSNWLVFLVANLGLMLITTALFGKDYNLLAKVVEKIVDVIKNFFDSIFETTPESNLGNDEYVKKFPSWLEKILEIFS
ncbi:MAG: hypothetical protein QXI16_00590 [Sulfolobaceae archaeon]